MGLIFKDGWIAKDKSEYIYFYTDKPKKSIYAWTAPGNNFFSLKNIEIDDDWEDSLYQVVNGKIIKPIIRPDFEVDDLILVSNDNKTWIRRHFARWNDINCNNPICAWIKGRTRFTTSTVSYWAYYKKYTE